MKTNRSGPIGVGRETYKENWCPTKKTQLVTGPANIFHSSYFGLGTQIAAPVRGCPPDSPFFTYSPKSLDPKLTDLLQQQERREKSEDGVERVQPNVEMKAHGLKKLWPRKQGIIECFHKVRCPPTTELSHGTTTVRKTCHSIEA